MSGGGFNPLRWDCDLGGVGANCFNRKCRPKIEQFSDCFRGAINFGDVDGMVEIDSRFCLIEWKGEKGKLGTGQRIAYERFTRGNSNAVFVIRGDAETMAVYGYSLIWGGKESPFVSAELPALKERIKAWANLPTESE